MGDEGIIQCIHFEVSNLNVIQDFHDYPCSGHIRLRNNPTIGCVHLDTS